MMDVFELITIGFDILEFAIDWALIMAGMTFLLIMVKTLLDVSKVAIVDQAGPGISRLRKSWKR